MNNFKTEVLKAAKSYIERGWLVFPLHSVDENRACTCGTPGCTDAGKHPRLARGLKEASRDPSQIEKWFGEDAQLSNVAIVTGEVSGITVIDIDIGEGKMGAESWAEAIGEKGEPVTLMAQTGSGGMHVFFQYNSALKTAANVLGKGVDCRNDGGYVVAAPSRHRSGGVYAWLDPSEKISVLPAHLSRRKETRGRPKRDDMYRGKYTIRQVKTMLDVIPSHDRDLWRSVGIILGREFNRADEAWDLYVEWAKKDEGKRTRGHEDIMKQAFFELSQIQNEKQLTIGTIVKNAIDNGWVPKKGEVPIGNFVYFGPGNNYIYRPTGTYWIAYAVDAVVSPVNEEGKIIEASKWLQSNWPVTSITCAPEIEEDYLKGHDCKNGEIILSSGAALYNTYRRPTIEAGDVRLAHPFVDHVKRVFNKPGDADQFLDYMAHRVQKPWEKPRFALLIAGGQGVGKDTAIEMCCPAIGSWNVANIDPSALESNFNEYAAATLVRISEAANLHEMTKWAFNERTKVLIAGSPDVCVINQKYGQKFSVRMYCGVIITTNHLAGGIYIPADDRRYDVIDAATKEEMRLEHDEVRAEYFADLWSWFLAGGQNHIAALLQERDISNFSANNGQRKTEAHKTVVASGMISDHWLADILDELGNPKGIRTDVILKIAEERGENVQKIKTSIGNILGRLDYCSFKNPNTKDGRWRIGGKNRVVYVKKGTAFDYDPTEELKKEPF